MAEDLKPGDVVEADSEAIGSCGTKSLDIEMIGTRFGVVLKVWMNLYAKQQCCCILLGTEKLNIYSYWVNKVSVPY